MTSRRWRTGVTVTFGLVGSLLLSVPPSTAVTAQMSTVKDSSASAGFVPPPAQGQDSDTDEQRGQPQRSRSDGEKTRCLGLVPSPYPYARTEFVCNDWRFGPAVLPRTGILGGILKDYNRFGTLTPVEFLNKYWNPVLDSGQGNWRFPPNDGFGTDTNSQVIATEVTLVPGQLLDRFGNEFGTFLAPARTKYGERSIPPSNLNTEDPRYPYNYHLYRVKKPTTVCAGPTAPWFEQPGGGVQYVTTIRVGPGEVKPYCPTVRDGSTINSLVGSGNLERAN